MDKRISLLAFLFLLVLVVIFVIGTWSLVAYCLSFVLNSLIQTPILSLIQSLASGFVLAALSGKIYRGGSK